MNQISAQFNTALLRSKLDHNAILTLLRTHPDWNRFGGVREFTVRTAYHKLSADEGVQVSNFPQGSIFQTTTRAQKPPTLIVTPTNIYVDPLNFYCSQIPDNVEYRVINENDLSGYWSNAVVVDEKTAFKEYSVPAGAHPSLFINSNGEHAFGYSIKDLKKSSYSLKLELTNPRVYKEEDLLTLRSWEEAGKPIYTVANICNTTGGAVLSTILSMDGLVKPYYSKDHKGDATYTLKTLEEYLTSNEFWEKVFINQPTLMPLFRGMSDEVQRNAMFSAYALHALTQ